ncbi:hypothetical protein BC829DRAFT_366736, partial [Chytridium lagenaria]
PDGIIAHLRAPECGRRHDCFLLRQKPVLEYLPQHLTCDVLYLYGDPAYALNNHLLSPYKGTYQWKSLLSTKA